MSDWMEREQRERRDAWMDDLGLAECETCGAVYFVNQYGGESLHEKWHEARDDV